MAKRNSPCRVAVRYPRRASELAWAIRLSLHVLAAGSFIAQAPTVYAAPPLPPPPNELPRPAANFIESGTLNGSGPPLPDGNTLTIDQQSERAILRWDRFNIGSAATVNFKQNSAASVTLNRINGQYGASQIFGRLNATGQIYLLNSNGIVFGRGSQTNVGALVASSLEITQAALDNGITGAIDQQKPAFTPFKDPDGNPLPGGAITVQDGASIAANSGGSVMLFAPDILNSGTIKTPDGQAILAAGQGIYLAASDNAAERGLLVEIDGAGGTVQNLGQIIAERGGVSLLGLAVKQDGLVRATTSVRANGTIQLLARDTASVNHQSSGRGYAAVAQHTGSVEFGVGSVTEVVLDNSPDTTVDAAVQPTSRIDVMGKQIHLLQDSRLSAKGGDVNLIALADPSTQLASARSLSSTAALKPNADVRIQMEQGSVIDVSGNDALLAMERNALKVELRGTELSDVPQQRNGILSGRTITVDLRKGTPLADISGAKDNIERNVAERLSRGGHVSVQSTGDIRFLPDAKVDVSGGKLNYQAGYLNTTRLLSAGQVIDIGQADPNRHYDAILGTYSLRDKKWGVTQTWDIVGGRGVYQAAYTEGQDAGRAHFAAPGMLLDGVLLGHSVTGPYQRRAAQLPLGGELMLGLAPLDVASDLFAPNVNFRAASRSQPLDSHPLDFNQPLPQAQQDQLELSTRYLADGGFTRTTVYSNGKVTLPADTPITLLPGALRPGSGSATATSSFTVAAQAIDIAANIEAPGAAISLTGLSGNLLRPLSLPASDTAGSVTLAQGVTLGTRGLWTNDTAQAASSSVLAPVAVDGGSLRLSGETLRLGQGVTLDASSGGWLASSGQLTRGDGGNITLKATQRLELGGDLTLRSHALRQGGTLDLTTTGLVLEGGSDAASLATQQALWHGPQQTGAGQALRLPSFIFERGGFANYKLAVQGNDARNTQGFTFAPGAIIRPRQDSWILNRDFRQLASGTPMQAVAQVGRLTDDLRSPTHLNFKTLSSTLVPTVDFVMPSRAGIETDPGAQVSISSVGRLQIDGHIVAPAGRIGLAVEAMTDGFQPRRALWLGPTALLDARGTVVRTPNDQGLQLGQVWAGGQVSLSATDAYVIAAQGSRIDVSGVAADVDLAGATGTAATRARVAGAAGSIDIRASEGIILDGTLAGHAAAATAAGGSLSLGVAQRSINRDNQSAYPYPTDESDATLRVVQDTQMRLRAGFTSAEALDSTYNGKTYISAQQIQDGGFDQLNLATLSLGHIDFQGSRDATQPLASPTLNLNLRRGLLLNTPLLTTSNQSRVDVQAAYVALGSASAAQSAQGGAGRFAVHAKLVDVYSTALQGFGDTRIVSDGDIRLSAEANQAGTFFSAGQLTFQANQIYPTTLTQFTVQAIPDNTPGAVSAPGAIVLQSNPGGRRSSPVLSAGGRVIVNASRIDQSGVLKAPFGQIELNTHEGQLSLNKDSLTSVSGEGQTVLFGRTENTDWVYGAASNPQAIYTDSTQNPPRKQISLNGADVEIQSGAKVDVSGGGDLLAYEWIPGPGGSKDALAPGITPNTYAILPALGPAYAPFDAQESAGSTLRPGDSIDLAAGAGLAAGRYTLLPARYALLPGAYLVTALSGYQDVQPGAPRALADGTPVVAGYRTVLGTDLRESRSTGYAIRPGRYATQLAEYKLSRANDFFAARAAALELVAPRLPRDAGNVSISASKHIDLSGELYAAAEHARGAQVDIAATRLAVVAKAGDSDGLGDPYVELVADKLNQLGAESLLLGGRRHDSAAGTRVDAQSDDVLIAAGADLHAPDVTLVSSNNIQVGQGATLRGIGSVAADAPGETLLLQGDGALLRVAAGPQVHIVRAAETGVHGTLNIASGARLQADRSMSLDASVSTRNQGQIVMNGGSLNLGASLITLGAAADVTEGLVLSNTDLAQMKVDELVLTSRAGVQLRGAVDLSFKDLAIEAAGLLGSVNPAGTTTRLTARKIALSNPASASLPTATPLAQGGDLRLNAEHIVLGKGEFAIQGYARTDLSAQADITTEGKGGLKVDSGQLNLDAARITGATGADYAIDASGRLRIAAHAAAAAEQATQGLGARLAISALGIEDAGRIEQHSGSVSLHARGKQAGDNVALTAGAVLDVSGVDKQFADVTQGTSGGQATLTADAGDVIITAAKLDVSAAHAGGDGGHLSVASAQGRTDIRGADLRGTTGRAGQGASFTLDTDTLADGTAPGRDYAGLNAALNDGGFDAARNLRLRRGDIVVAADSTTTARQVTLSADQGRIDVAGKINAAGDGGGAVVLSAAEGITLARSARVYANATGAGKRGGSVDLRTVRNGVLIADVNPNDGPIIDVSGGPAQGTAAGEGGRVNIRLSRAAALSVADLDSTNDQLHLGANSIQGAASTTLEAYQTYALKTGGSATAIDATLSDPWLGDARGFMQSAADIGRQLGKTGDNTFHLLPGIEVQSDGDLTLAQNWDLSGQRFGGEPGVLTLRAQGELNLNAALSDGFNGTAPNSPLLKDRSWSYRLVAGADNASADVLALRDAAALTDTLGTRRGSVNIGDNVLVRTGSGDIDVAAGYRLNFANLGSVLYTAGVASGLELDNRAPNSPFAKPPTKYIPWQGGNVHVVAQGDIIGSRSPDDKTQLINEWLPQQKKITGNFFTPSQAAGWWANYSAFQQNIAAFGGGDVQIRAGGDITRLSASVPTTGYYDEQTKQTVTVGGGDLSVHAGGDINSGIFFVARGTGDVRAGGALASGRNIPAARGPLDSILAVMDARFDVETRGGLTLQAVINPTLTPVLPPGVNPNTDLAVFPSYSSASGVRLRSITGDIVLRDNSRDTATIAESILPRGAPGSESYLALGKSAGIYPGSLEAIAFGGGIDVRNDLTLYPSPRGNLQLLAARDVRTHGSLLVSDADSNILPTLNAPVASIDSVAGPGATNISLPSFTNVIKPYHAAIPAHAGDAEPVRIVALEGDIDGAAQVDGITSVWDFPKAAIIQAGHDIRQIRLHGQNLADTDLTRVTAGRDIVQRLGGDEIRLGGPGNLLLHAGRNIDLGQSTGVVTVGNLYNPALAAGGANLTLLAGSTTPPEYQAFDAHYLAMTGLDPVSGALVDAQARAIGDQYRQVIVSYMRKLEGKPDLAQEAALAAYAALPLALRSPAILQGFYAELRAAGIEANQDSASHYVRGKDAIKILFPGEDYAGDLNLFFSQIYTLAGGDINLLVPGGRVNAGLANTPANAPNKTPAQLGIVAQGPGSVRAFARDDFLVNQSRVFTLQGGDILLWSSRGNIDAGRGAKTAISAPPPTFTTDANGKVTTNFTDAVAGSGIRAIVTRPGIAPGSVDLIAPEGEVNAGDAGIGAAGNLNIAAARVRGADNIQVGGIATGIPATDSGGLAAGFAGVNDVAGSASKNAEDAVKDLNKGAGTEDADSGLSFLDVEVIGYGSGDKDDPDVELRKRKTPDTGAP